VSKRSKVIDGFGSEVLLKDPQPQWRELLNHHTRQHRRRGRLIPPNGATQFDHSRRLIALARPLTARNRLRLKANFVSGFKLIWVVRSWPKNIDFRKSEIVVRFSCPASTRGAYASSRNAGRDAMDAEVPLTSGAEADGKIVWS
jgi:hypothetical protein